MIHHVKVVVVADCVVDFDVDDNGEDDVLKAPEVGLDEDVKGDVGRCAAVTSAAVAEAGGVLEVPDLKRDDGDGNDDASMNAADACQRERENAAM